MTLTEQMEKLKIELPQLPREELEHRIMSAFNGAAMADIMMEAKMPLQTPVLVAMLRSVQKDLRGERGEAF